MDPVSPHSAAPTPSSPEQEFLRAMQEYKTQSGRQFPTWSEVLEVARSLGYSKPGGRDVGRPSPRP